MAAMLVLYILQNCLDEISSFPMVYYRISFQEPQLSYLMSPSSQVREFALLLLQIVEVGAEFGWLPLA
jgi:hypothetical protein